MTGLTNGRRVPGDSIGVGGEGRGLTASVQHGGLTERLWPSSYS